MAHVYDVNNNNNVNKYSMSVNSLKCIVPIICIVRMIV